MTMLPPSILRTTTMLFMPASVCLLTFVLLLPVWVVFSRKFHPLPRGYKKQDVCLSAKNESCDDAGVISFNAKRRQRKIKGYDVYDAICIGSGIGNLTAAALLSLCGWKVLVLERHYSAGGATHTFQTKFGEHEVGVHYVGTPPTGLLALITGRSAEAQIRFQPMDEPNASHNPGGQLVYDKVLIGDRVIKFCAGVDNLRDELARHFPSKRDQSAIDAYFRLVKDASHHTGFYICKLIRPMPLRRLAKRIYFSFINPSLLRYQTMTTWQTLTEHLGDDASPELLNVLCSRFGQIGPSPFADTFCSHACVVNHFLEGGFYPVGGSSEFVDKISPTILAAGGAIKVRKHVEKILVNENTKQVEGVQLSNGTRFHSPVVLSGAGIRNTYKYLLPESLSAFKFPLQRMEEEIGISVKFVFCFFDLDGTSNELGFNAANLWELPLSSPDANLHDFLQSFLESSPEERKPMPLFISSVSAKDPSYQKRHPGKSSAVVITYSRMEDFQEWGELDQRGRRKSHSYKVVKETYRELLTEQLHRHFPKTMGKVLHSEVATPLTTKSFLNAPDGEFRGLDENVAKAAFQTFFEPETPVRGLYLCGQELTMLGVFSALQAGVLAASAVLKYGTFFDLLLRRNLVSDLKRLRNRELGKS